MEPNALYQFRGIRGRAVDGEETWAYPPGVYRFLGIAMDYRTRQEKVVYVGVGGKDDGVWHLACLSDWDRDFTLVPQEQPEKVVDMTQKGSGF